MSSPTHPYIPRPLTSTRLLPPAPSPNLLSVFTSEPTPLFKRKMSSDSSLHNAMPPKYHSHPVPLNDHIARAMTPSTSTVAHSSSPRPADSSPSRSAPHTAKKARREESTLSVTLEQGKTLLFGRHRRRAPSAAPMTTSLNSAVPARFRQNLLIKDREAEIVHLPREAKHASRVHAVLESVTSTQARVLVVGQNGIRLRVEGVTHRLSPGETHDIHCVDRPCDIDFFGARVYIQSPQQHVFEDLPLIQEVGREPLFTPFSDEEDRVRAPPSPQTSMPPSSPLFMPLQDMEVDDDRSRGSSPLSQVSEREVDNEEKEDNDVKEVKEELIEAVVKPDSRVDSPLAEAPVPDEVDLPALIASAIVFSGSSKLSLPDLVKHMLEAQPSLKAHGDEAQWSTWVNAVLNQEGMFGKVARNGKDASGRPLLSHYFYNPALDPEISRANQLGGLVRPLRAAQRAGGKAIDWRPVGGGRRR